MSFKTKADLEAALEWFHKNKLLPKPELVNTWRDDHEMCVEVNFDNVFNFSFWYITTQGLWCIARADQDRENAKLVWEMIIDTFEDDPAYTFASGLDEQKEAVLDESLHLRMQLMKAQVENMEG